MVFNGSDSSRQCIMGTESSRVTSVPLSTPEPTASSDTSLAGIKYNQKKEQSWSGMSLETASKSFVHFMTKLAYFNQIDVNKTIHGNYGLKNVLHVI